MTWRCCVYVWTVSLLLFHAPAWAQDVDAVFEKLKRYDSIYEAGFTATGTLKSDDWLILGRLKIATTQTWRFTYDADRCGYVMEMTDYEKPKYLARDVEPKTRRTGSYTGDGAMILSIRTRQWGYWGADASGEYYEDTKIRVTPENEINEHGKMHNASLFGPRDVGPNIPKRTILWSLGRGYSKVINRITSVKELADGRVMVAGAGMQGADRPGRWELEVDPAAAWMVRHARFYSNAAPETIRCEMKNEGTMWSTSYCIPETAMFNYLGSIEGGDKPNPFDRPSLLTFAPHIEKFDDKLYDDAQQAVTKNRPPKLTIHDYRVTPTFIFQPDELIESARKHAESQIAELPTTPMTQPDNQIIRMPLGTSSTSQHPWYILPARWAIAALVASIIVAVGAYLVLRKLNHQRK